MPHFAANLSMLFAEHPFLDRFAAASAAGFDAVEFLFPYEYAAEEIASRLAAHQLDLVLFNMPPGDWNSGDRGMASIPGREREFAENITLALAYAKKLGVPRLHAMAGIPPPTCDPEAVIETYVTNIAAAAAQCASAGIDLMIEPINSNDMPGYYLNAFPLALEVIEAIDAAGGVAPTLQFDIYHCARIHGDVPRWIERAAAHIGHFQIAGIPDRHEPDIGDLPLSDIIAAIARFAPGKTIGCEYRPLGQTEDGLSWLVP